MLRTALGPAIAGFLDDPMTVEVMLNPDGRLWIDRLSEGLADSGKTLSAADGERIVRLVAHHVGVEVHNLSPRVSAELPETGERFEGLLPPVVAAPAFAIRKPAVAVFTLEDYVTAGIMTGMQAEALRLRGNNAFDTSSISGENSNLVDANDGTKMEVDLAFMEFDSSLRAQLDFRSESCIKALTTNLGVEELRAVMRY